MSALQIVETHVTRYCESCHHEAEHSVLTPSDPRMAPATQCTRCGWCS